MSPSRRRLMWSALASLPVIPLAGMGLAMSVVNGSGDSLVDPAWSWGMLIVLIQCVVVAVAVPFCAAARDGLREAATRLTVFCTGCGILGVWSTVRYGGTSVGMVLRAQVVIFCFGALLAALVFVARPEHRWRMQIVAALLGLVMVGSVLCCNPIVEMMPGAVSRGRLVSFILHTNPIVILTGSIYNYDFLRGGPGRMYELCVIGPYYPQPYPAWWIVASIFLAGAGVVMVAKHLLTRWMKPKEVVQNA